MVENKINMVLSEMAKILDKNRKELLEENKVDMANGDRTDRALFDRLIIDEHKIDGMIDSLQKVIAKDSPLDKTLYAFEHENGLKITNKTVPFGTVMIIYESRPDVTVEATATALKSGNKILLKGGKEAINSNLFLHNCWMQALEKTGQDLNLIRYLNMDRKTLQAFLKEPDTKIDLIIPRGGEKLIDYVKSVAQCPVLVSGRGNNFLYVAESADLNMAKEVIVNAKLSKISACNALDKVLLNQKLPQYFINDLTYQLARHNVELIEATSDAIWMEEFLDKKIVIEQVNDAQCAIDLINKYSGGHSASIISEDEAEVERFLHEVDCAAVFHNASTRFTDGYQFGLGSEMAISTEKLHHRGPLGMEQLVTNKWYVLGNGQIR